jgi:hypothetical protein
MGAENGVVGLGLAGGGREGKSAEVGERVAFACAVSPVIKAAVGLAGVWAPLDGVTGGGPAAVTVVVDGAKSQKRAMFYPL